MSRPEREGAPQAAPVTAGAGDRYAQIGSISRTEIPGGDVLLALKVEVDGQKYGYFNERLASDPTTEKEIIVGLFRDMSEYLRNADTAKPTDLGIGWAFRAKVELDQLVTRYRKLEDFIGTPMFKGLPVEERQTLANQFYHMEGYKYALEKRLALHRRKTIGFGEMP